MKLLIRPDYIVIISHLCWKEFLSPGSPGTWTRMSCNATTPICDDFSLVNKDQLENTVRIASMYLYALSNVENISVKKLSDQKTRDFLISQGLKRGVDHWAGMALGTIKI